MIPSSRPAHRAAALAWLLPSLIALASGPAVAAPSRGATPIVVPAISEATDDKDDLPLSASLTIENAVGRSTFATNEYDRNPYWNLYVASEIGWTLVDELELHATAAFDFDTNLLETSDSSSTRPHQIRAGDLKLGISGGKLGSWLDETLTWSGGVGLGLPTSLLSRFTRKIVALDLSCSLAWDALPWLSVTYGAVAGKNFNRSTTAALDPDDFSIAPISRAGGAEALGEGLVAVAGASTSFWLDHSLSLGFSFLDKGSATVAYELVHSFSYHAFPEDELTSPYASSGRGRSDLSYATIELGWELHDNLSLGLGSLVAQAPKTPDNRRLRFPFWDTTNGANNRQVFYLDVIGSY